MIDLSVIASLTVAGCGVAVVTLWAWQVEQLAARLRRLCQSTGRPEIRTLRPRGSTLDLRSLERTLLSLERDQGIPGRRVPGYRSMSLVRDMEERTSRLEERGLR